MTILNIETSSILCSVAVSSNDKIIFERISDSKLSHSSSLGVYIKEALSIVSNLDAIAISGGPGSYTGLRIGTSMAKGLCIGLNIPLLSIPTLEILTVKAINNYNNQSDETLFCPMIDARRMEVYTALYDNKLRVIKKAKNEIINEEIMLSFPKDKKIIFFGDGSSKIKSFIDSNNYTYLDNIQVSATDMITLAQESYSKQKFQNVAYYEPFYMKEFNATIPKNMFSCISKTN